MQILFIINQPLNDNTMEVFGTLIVMQIVSKRKSPYILLACRDDRCSCLVTYRCCINPLYNNYTYVKLVLFGSGKTIEINEETLATIVVNWSHHKLTPPHSTQLDLAHSDAHIVSAIMSSKCFFKNKIM